MYTERANRCPTAVYSHSNSDVWRGTGRIDPEIHQEASPRGLGLFYTVLQTVVFTDIKTRTSQTQYTLYGAQHMQINGVDSVSVWAGRDLAVWTFRGIVKPGFVTSVNGSAVAVCVLFQSARLISGG